MSRIAAARIAAARGAPRLGNEIWEHADHLCRQNRRADYLDAR